MIIYTLETIWKSSTERVQAWLLHRCVNIGGETLKVFKPLAMMVMMLVMMVMMLVLVRMSFCLWGEPEKPIMRQFATLPLLLPTKILVSAITRLIIIIIMVILTCHCTYASESIYPLRSRKLWSSEQFPETSLDHVDHLEFKFWTIRNLM